MRDRIYNALPFVLLMSGLIITVLFFRNEIRWHEVNQKNYYEDQLERIKQNIIYRLQTYVDEQVAAGAYIASTDKVARYDWRDFVNALQLETNYPGINGLGYAVPVPKNDTAAFLQQVRQDHAPGFKISSLGQVPEAKDLFVIKYLEPQLRNYKALGLDMGSEPKRREAMEKARDTRKPAISEKVVLVQDKDKSPGFLIYIPVFKSHSLIGVDSTKFMGWAYAPFVASYFMKGVLRRELSLKNLPYQVELYDGDKTDSTNLLYKSWVLKPEQTDSAFSSKIHIYGNHWTLRLLPVADYKAVKNKNLAYLILIGGILLNLALFFLLRALANTRKNALALADKMTQELRELNLHLDRKVADRTQELAAKNKQLSTFAENLKIAYEDMEVKVKFRNLQLEKQVKALQEEILKLKNPNG